MVADHLNEVIAGRGPTEQVLGVGVHGDEFVAGLVEAEEPRRHPSPAVQHRVCADRIHELDAWHPLIKVNLNDRGHEPVREIPVGGGVHLPLHVRVGQVAVDDPGPLLRELTGRIGHHLRGRAVECRQRGERLGQITGRDIDHVRDNAAIKRPLREQIRVHVPHAALPDREHVLHPLIPLTEPGLHPVVELLQVRQRLTAHAVVVADTLRVVWVRVHQAPIGRNARWASMSRRFTVV